MSTFILMICFLLVSPCFADLPANQVTSLEEFYTATNGPTWTDNANWLTGDPCVNVWFGLQCNGANTRVLQVILPENNLQGTLIETPILPRATIMYVLQEPP